MFFSFPYLQRQLEASCSDTDIRHSYHTIDIRCEVRGNIKRSCSRICIVKVDKIFTLFKSLKRHYVPLLFFRTEILYWLGLATDALSWAPITLMWVDLQAKRTRCKPEFHTFFPSKIKSMLTKQNKKTSSSQSEIFVLRSIPPNSIYIQNNSFCTDPALVTLQGFCKSSSSSWHSHAVSQ